MNQAEAKPAEVWKDYWFKEIEPYSITLFRSLFGFYLFFYFIRFYDKVPQIFSSAGVYVPYIENTPAPGPAAASLIYWATIAVIGLFTFGYRLKIITPLLFGLFLHHFNLCFAIEDCSFDRLILIFLLVLSFSDAGLSWNEIRRGERPVRSVSGWGSKLICLQLALLYFGAGLAKLVTPGWLNGKILELSFLSGYSTAVGHWFYSVWPASLYAVLTIAVILFELSIGAALYSRRTRNLAIVFGTLFHLSNAIMLNIPEFMVCAAAYPLFLPPEESKRILNRLVRVPMVRAR